MRSLQEKLDEFKDKELASLEDALGITPENNDENEEAEPEEQGIRIAEPETEEEQEKQVAQEREEAYVEAEEAITQAKQELEAVKRDPEKLKTALEDVADNLEALKKRKADTRAKASDDAYNYEETARTETTEMETPATDRAASIENEISTALSKVKQLLIDIQDDVETDE